MARQLDISQQHRPNKWNKLGNGIGSISMPNQIDWSGIRAAAVVIGVREAARRAAINLTPKEAERFVQRVLKRSTRQGWTVQKKAALAQSQVSEQSKPLSSTVLNGSDATLSKLKEDGEATKIHLSKGIRKSAEHMASLTGARIFKAAKAVKETVAAASQIHGWDQSSQGGSISLNILTGQAAVQINTKPQE